MKQKITIEQLNELSEKGTKRLRTWLRDHYLGWPTRLKPLPEEQAILDAKADLLMNIGQLIEFLDENAKDQFDCMVHYSYKFWIIGKKDYADVSSFENSDKTELCDALWQAVRDILEKRNE